MCGMAGWLSYSRDLRQHRETVQRMTDTMALRGPDGEGLWIEGPIALGHRRLSVIDLEGGRQPMAANLPGHDQDVAVISYVGEVYNFRELRTELAAKGHVFRTNSDTEVVLRAYVEWGEQFAERLNGMYGFALWDIRKQELLLVRDRMGVKPLFYFPTADGVIFGSEPKAILANALVPRRIQADGMRELLELVKTPGQAIFAGMKEVLPGEIIKVNRDGIKARRYWQLEAREHGDSLQQTIQHTRDLLEDIVDRQMITDVPLCVLLSGGLDSSTITSLASRKLLAQGKENVRTFSLDFKDHGEEFVSDGFRLTPDTPFVWDLVKWVDSNHGQIILDSRELADPALRTAVVRALDLPPAYWADLYPSLYRLFQEVRKQSTVALSGEAADEVFGGYRWFHDPAAIPADTFPWMSMATVKLFDGKNLFDQGLLAKLDMPSFVQDSYRQALAAVPELPGEDATNRRMRQITHIHLTRYVQSLLDRKDRMSMAVGLELRVPFCDHRLVEYAFNIPWEMKTFDGREKSILRAAARDLLPESIVQRIKNPYPATQDPAYEKELRSAVSAIVADPNAPVRQLLDLERVKDTLDREAGKVSPLHERMGMERVVGMNGWLAEYDVSVDI